MLLKKRNQLNILNKFLSNKDNLIFVFNYTENSVKSKNKIKEIFFKYNKLHTYKNDYKIKRFKNKITNNLIDHKNTKIAFKKLFTGQIFLISLNDENLFDLNFIKIIEELSELDINLITIKYKTYYIDLKLFNKIIKNIKKQTNNQSIKETYQKTFFNQLFFQFLLLSYHLNSIKNLDK